METAEQTEASKVFSFPNSPSANNHFRTMADVCEAFVFSVYSVDYKKFVSIRVHSWF